MARIHPDAGLADLLFDHELDRQSVAIPAGHVRRVKTGKPLALDDDVLEDLVDGMTDVNLAVGIGRAVVEHKPGPLLPGFAELAVKLQRLPALELFRLALRQVALHRESGGGEVQRGFVVNGHGVQLG